MSTATDDRGSIYTILYLLNQEDLPVTSHDGDVACHDSSFRDDDVTCYDDSS